MNFDEIFQDPENLNQTENAVAARNYFGGWDLNSFSEDGSSRTQYFLLIYFLCLSITFVVCNTLIKKWNLYSVPEPGVAVLIGALISLLSHSVGYSDAATRFDSTFFFWYLLPPLIFQAGFTQDRLPFFKNWFVIMLYANVGTVISTIIFGYGLFYLGQANLLVPLPFMECLCFGALISATDPVSTLSVFADLNVDPGLQAIVYGSSAIDDAVAIVMLRAFQKYIFEEYLATDVAATITLYLVTCLIASFAIGVLFGAIAALIIKYNDIEGDSKSMICFIICLLYISYFACTVLEMSGIISCIFTAISLRYFLEVGEIMSKDNLKSTGLVLSIFAYFVETAVFFCIGMSIVAKLYSLGGTEDILFIAWAFLLALIGRVASIYPLSYLANYFNGYISLSSCSRTCSPFFTILSPTAKTEIMPQEPNVNTKMNQDAKSKQETQSEDLGLNQSTNYENDITAPSYIDMNTQHMILFAGLRGPIAYAAAELYPTTSEHYNTVYFATLAIVLVNIFISGSLTPFALTTLGIDYDKKGSPTIESSINDSKDELAHDFDKAEESGKMNEMTNTRVNQINIDLENNIDNDEVNNGIDDDNENMNMTDEVKQDDISYHENKDLEKSVQNSDIKMKNTLKNSKKRISPPKFSEHSGRSFNRIFVKWFKKFERNHIIPHFRKATNNCK